MLKHFKTLTGHQHPLYALATYGDSFLSAGHDKGVVDWALYPPAFRKILFPPHSTVYTLHIHENRLYVGERSGLLTIFDLIDGKVIQQIRAHRQPVFCIKTLHQKNELPSCSEDGQVAIWSLSDLRELYRFQVSSEALRAIAISPDGQELALAAKDHHIHFYQSSDYSHKTSIEAHRMPVTALAYHPQGHYLLSGGRDAQLNVWNTKEYTLKQNIPAHLFAIYSIVFHPKQAFFATGSRDKSIKLWDARDFRLLKIQSLEKSGFGHRHSVNALTWSAQGDFLLSAGDDHLINLWEMK